MTKICDAIVMILIIGGIIMLIVGAAQALMALIDYLWMRFFWIRNLPAWVVLLSGGAASLLLAKMLESQHE